MPVELEVDSFQLVPPKLRLTPPWSEARMCLWSGFPFLPVHFCPLCSNSNSFRFFLSSFSFFFFLSIATHPHPNNFLEPNANLKPQSPFLGALSPTQVWPSGTGSACQTQSTNAHSGTKGKGIGKQPVNIRRISFSRYLHMLFFIFLFFFKIN